LAAVAAAERGMETVEEGGGVLRLDLEPHSLSFKADILELNIATDGRHLTFFSDFIAGCVGGSSGILAGYPLDTIKVRQQVTQLAGTRPTVIVTASQALTNEGTRALFRGMAFPLVSEGFRSSLFFGVYGNLIGPDTHHHPPEHTRTFLAAGLAGGIQGLAATPIELVKIQLQSQNGRLYRGPADCARHLYSVGGLRALFHGTGITVTREIPALGTYMTTYSAIRHHSTSPGHHHPSLAYDLLAGGTAGVASWLVTMPLDVIKSRLQSDCLTTPRYSGVINCLMLSWKADGLTVFWRGIGVTCLRAFPTNAVTLVIYSKSLALLQNKPL
jgi:hypothetical protein